MNEFQTILFDTANRLFTDKLDKTQRIAAEQGEWLGDLWTAVSESGFLNVLVSEGRGGSAASWSDAAILLKAVGTHAVPLPVAETIVAAWLLDQAGLDVPEGPLTFAIASSPDTVAAVPFAPWSESVVIASPEGNGIRVARHDNPRTENTVATIARDPVADVAIDETGAVCGHAEMPISVVHGIGAFVRAAGIAGALQAVLAQAVQYAGERVQFGRPISKFQAIQHQLAELATQAASVGVAVDTAARALDAGPTAAEFDIAVAKIRAADAAQAGAAIAHQTHGAIGFTYEHGLHFWTRRLWSWAPEFGGTAYWAKRLGQHAIRGGGDALWAEITSR